MNIRSTQIINTTQEANREDASPVLVVISGNLLDIGRILPIVKKDLVIGRDQNVDFRLHDSQISRRHLKISELKTYKNEPAFIVTDMQSTNGTLLNGKKIESGWCRLGETISLGESILLFRLETVSKFHTPSNPLRLISKDPLTGVFNRRAFDQIAKQEHQQAAMMERCYSLILIDIDNFKKINDSLGHPTGDIVLKKVAESMNEQVRSSDILARVGGEEFAVLLPSQTALGGFKLAERLRMAVMRLNLEKIKPGLKITISLGVSTGDPREDTFENVYAAADRALLKAKKEGRNQTVVDSFG